MEDSRYPKLFFVEEKYFVDEVFCLVITRDEVTFDY